MKLGNMRLGGHKNVLPASRLATGFHTVKKTTGQRGRARRGLLRVNGVSVETPMLFPVINLLTGPPPLHRNGATHKFLKRQLIFEDHRPGLMSEVLHFTDYPFRPRSFREWFPHTAGGNDVKTLDYWVQKSFEGLEKPSEAYHPLFFLDSGGFRLLFNREVDISEFGYEPTPESILELQLAYGADIVASLDHPIPPMLDHAQAEERIGKSVANAVTLMKMLYQEGKRDLTGKRPFPILAVHGQTPEQIRKCVLQLLNELAQDDLIGEPFGLGIGSLVPLRMSNSSDKVVMIVQAAVESLYSEEAPKRFDADRIPIHAFGITGDMIPVLTYLGVDTFDSSSYVKSASVLDYYDPLTWSQMDFRKLTKLPCQCRACDGITEEELGIAQEVLRGEKIQGNIQRLGLKVGRFTVEIKSDVYGIIAYHNLCLQDREITRIREAISDDDVAQHVVHFSQAHARAQKLVEFVAEIDLAVREALGHVQVDLFPRSHEDIENQYNSVSLVHNPEAFDISTIETYAVPQGKDRLLLLACSQAKPYRSSKSHGTVFRFLREHLGDDLESLHKVTVSGLYGPVPLEFEDEKPVRSYEYILSSSARKQKELITNRLVEYILRHGNNYERIVAYVTAGAYRSVVEEAFARVRERWAGMSGQEKPSLILAPTVSHGTGTKDLVSHVNLRELVSVLYPERAGVRIMEQGTLVEATFPPANRVPGARASA